MLPTTLVWQPPKVELAQLEEEFGLHRKDARRDEAQPTRCVQLAASAVGLVLVSVGAVVLCREYLGPFMTWLAHLDGWYGPALFCGLFILISFPMMWGYIVLNFAAGYLYGLWPGFALTAVSASLGALVAFVLCRRFFVEYIGTTVAAYDNFKQIVRVIEGRQGFRIIMMARLTPVPFGLQNALFSTAKISKRRFVAATFLGSLPTQLLNTYMGTSLRSIEDVLSGRPSSSWMLVAQIAVAVAVTYLVNSRMKREVSLVCEREAAMAALAASEAGGDAALAKAAMAGGRLPSLAEEHPEPPLAGRLESLGNTTSNSSTGSSSLDDVNGDGGELLLLPPAHPSASASSSSSAAAALSAAVAADGMARLPAFLVARPLSRGAGPAAAGAAAAAGGHSLSDGDTLGGLSSDGDGSCAETTAAPPAVGGRATTARGHFARAHRRSQSAGPVLAAPLGIVPISSSAAAAGPPATVIRLPGRGLAELEGAP